MRNTVRILAVIGLLCAAAATAYAAAEDDEKTARTHLGHFRAEMEKIRFQIINAGARVKGGAVSMGRHSDKLEDTPATRCCAVNVVGLERHLTNLVDLWKELNACYVAEANDDAQVRLNFVRSDAGSLVRAYENFRAAKQEHLLPGHQAMIKGFLLLEQSVGELDECGEAFVRLEGEQ